MKTTESKEEHNDFKSAVQGHRIIPIMLTFSLSYNDTNSIAFLSGLIVLILKE